MKHGKLFSGNGEPAEYLKETRKPFSLSAQVFQKQEPDLDNLRAETLLVICEEIRSGMR
jgi:hypothetical protein